MFSFFKKLTKPEKEELLSLTYTDTHIVITLNKEFKNKAITTMYNNLFEELVDEELAVMQGKDLLISSQGTYELVNDERASLLMLPSYFLGRLEVKHRGFLDQDATFVIDFFTDDDLLTGVSILGSILKISSTEHYLLPESLSTALKLINTAHISKQTADRYSVIEFIQQNEDKNLEYKGLLNNDLVQAVQKVGLDITEDLEGNLNINPLISGLTTEDIAKNKTLISTHKDESLLLTKVENEKIVRHILGKDKLLGAKKISSLPQIPKEQVKAFKLNPEAFLPEFTPQEIDVTEYRLNRVLGLTTEVYIGFFGSVQLETPMSQVLQAGGDLVISDIEKEKIIEIVEALPQDKKDDLLATIERALEKGYTTIEIAETVVPINIVKPLLQKRTTGVTAPINDTPENKDLILDVAHNDEEELLIDLKLNNPEIINMSADRQASYWQNIEYEPKAHQVVALNWMISLYKNNFPGGLLADDMGLGKTYQVISFINYLYNIKTPKLELEKSRILIVAPSILLSAWKNEIEKFIIDNDKFKVKILQGKSAGLVRLRDVVKEHNSLDIEQEIINIADNNLDTIDLLNHNIYITTYETLSTYQLAFAQQKLFNFELCVFDEAQKIKNPSTRVSQAAKGISSNIPFTLMVTGTPIENELRDLWSMFDTFDPKFIRSWKEFREIYVKPLTSSNGNEIEMKLRKKISNYMLRRLKNDHLTDLPDKSFIYREITMNSEEIDKHNEITSADIHHMDKLQKLRLLSLHPSLLTLDKAISPEQLTTLTNPKDFFKPSKMQELLDLLDEIKSKKEKVLIFLIRHTMQTLLQSALNQCYDLDIDIINGKNKGRTVVDGKLEKFKNQDGFGVMILSPLAAGIGLTITEANHVIHLERHWNPAKEDQASDRVYRIGQTKDVSIYHLVHQSNDIKTFDSGLHELITNKKSLSTGTLIPTSPIKDSELIGTFFGEPDDNEKWNLMSPLEFEVEVMRLFEQDGYNCHRTTNRPTEQGVDIVAIKNKKTVVIQCKHTKNKRKQNNTAMYQLIAEAMAAYPDAVYIAATNYYFSDSAKSLASDNKILLMEQNHLLKPDNFLNSI